MDQHQFDLLLEALQSITVALQKHPIVRARMPEQLDVERSGNPKRSCDSPARIETLLCKSKDALDEAKAYSCVLHPLLEAVQILAAQHRSRLET